MTRERQAPTVWLGRVLLTVCTALLGRIGCLGLPEMMFYGVVQAATGSEAAMGMIPW